MEYILFAITGIFVGIAAGLLGIGGGLIVVPCLYYIFTHYGPQPNLAMHMAAATSLATMVFTASSSVYSHHRRGAVVWPVFWKLLPGILLGTIAGAVIAAHMSTFILKIAFAVFLLIMATRMLLAVKVHPSRQLPGTWGMNFSGLVIGLLSGLLGIGGGVVSVPFLTWCNMSMREAVGVSAACGLPIAIAGAVTTIITGWGITTNHLSLGYVYLPAALTIACTSVLAVFLGERLSLRLPVIFIKRIFAVVMLVAAIDLLR